MAFTFLGLLALLVSPIVFLIVGQSCLTGAARIPASTLVATAVLTALNLLWTLTVYLRVDADGPASVHVAMASAGVLVPAAFLVLRAVWRRPRFITVLAYHWLLALWLLILAFPYPSAG